MEKQINMKKKGIIGAVATILLVLADQFTKLLALENLKDHDAFVIWKGVFELRYLENRGAAFGIMQGKKAFFVIFTVIVLAALAYVYLKRIPQEPKFRYMDIICILFFSGAIGNFIDRVIRNYVVDFFYFRLINFPIFNVADIYVTVAAFAMILLGIFYYKEEDYNKIFPGKKVSKL